MLGTESEFSISLSHVVETRNSSFPSESTTFWLRSVTSRTVIPSRKRSPFSSSPARKIDLFSGILFERSENAVGLFHVAAWREFYPLILNAARRRILSRLLDSA